MIHTTPVSETGQQGEKSVNVKKVASVDWGGIVLTLVISAWGIHYIATIPPDEGGQSTFLPLRLLVGLLVCAVFVLKESVTFTTETEREEKPREQSFFTVPRLTLLGAFLVFLIILPWLGFVLSASFFVFSACLALGYRNIMTVALLTAGLVSITTYLFLKLLLIPLPIWPTI